MTKAPAITKTTQTQRLSGLPSYQEQRRYAEGPLYDALLVPEPSIVDGRQIVVFDDIFTNDLALRPSPNASAKRGHQGLTA